MKFLTRTIWLLSIVSLLQDICSEMLYPVLPVYLSSIGFSVLLIGVMEGLAEATIGFSKGYFGKKSDVIGKRLPFVQWGYALSAVAKPLMVLWTQPFWVLWTRILDRLGKGIRTASRDAMLSDEALPGTKGKVFGFHRGMDTLGAVIGPALALLYLYFNPGAYKVLFLLAFIPGMLAVMMTFVLKEKRHEPAGPPRRTSFFSFLGYWRESPGMYRKVVAGLLVFALFNSSDLFLILRLKDSGLDDTRVIGAYMLYNLVYALAAFPLGVLADRIGLRRMYVMGVFVFAIVYFGMSIEAPLHIYILLLAGYGLFAAATEGVAKAWISHLADKSETATAIGFYAGFQSICAVLASSLTGLVWYAFGPEMAFLATAIVAVSVGIYFLLMQESKSVRV
jgi:MFS family permease